MHQEHIERALRNSTHHNDLREVMNYAVLPAGKLFRPKLVEALTRDLTGNFSESAQHLATAVELHHAYTLVHDDLPSMDNDLIRRGKPSTHAQFGEWKAVLTGDALLILSFHEMLKTNSPELVKFFSWATGAKGLISGQFYDLATDGNQTFEHVLRIHELKTGRLIQVATVGSALLAGRKIRPFLRLGREIGVTFQLLDDLTELAANVSSHELLINPFLLSPEKALKELQNSHERLLRIFVSEKLTFLSAMMKEYFLKIQEEVLKNPDLHSEAKAWITTFV